MAMRELARDRREPPAHAHHRLGRGVGAGIGRGQGPELLPDPQRPVDDVPAEPPERADELRPLVRSRPEVKIVCEPMTDCVANHPPARASTDQRSAKRVEDIDPRVFACGVGLTGRATGPLGAQHTRRAGPGRSPRTELVPGGNSTTPGSRAECRGRAHFVKDTAARRPTAGPDGLPLTCSARPQSCFHLPGGTVTNDRPAHREASPTAAARRPDP